MVGEQHFQFEVGGDEGGLLVTVTHRTTGRRLVGRPNADRGVRGTQSRLVQELLDEFFVPADYVFATGRCGARSGGQTGTFYRVVHIPTGRSQSMDSITVPNTPQPHAQLLDVLVEELWQHGLLSGRAGSALFC